MNKKDAYILYFRQMLINWNCLNKKPVGNIIDLYSLEEKAKQEIFKYLKDFKISDKEKYVTFLFMGNYINIWK